jgi:hypothetical protein
LKKIVAALLVASSLAMAPAMEVPVTLDGSPESMARQNEVARQYGLPFVRTPAELRRLAARGELVPLNGNAHYDVVEGVAGRVARPEVKGFLESFAAGYHRACNEQLVVTSLTRPKNRQPPNAHPLSVHPAGIAMDLRVSQKAACRRWLENTLLAMERKQLLDVTREQKPPHYHVALFPDAYRVRVEEHDAEEKPVLALPTPAVAGRR